MKHNDAELMDIESNVQDIVRTPQTAPHLNTETNIFFSFYSFIRRQRIPIRM
jgi:hypothetical protein